MAYFEILLASIITSLLLFLASFVLPHSSLFPWNWPFIKIMPTMYLKSHQLYDKTTQILAQNKGTVLFNTSWFTYLDILVTSDPANVQHVLNSNFSNFHRGSAFRDAFDFLGEAAFIKDLKAWKEDKKFTHAFYKDTKFHKSIPRIISHTLEKGLIPILDYASRKNEVIDLQDVFNRYMLDSTCILATGFDLASLRVEFPFSPLLNAMDDIAVAVFYRQILPERVWKLQRWLHIGKEKNLAKASETFNRMLEDFVARKREMAGEYQVNGDDFDVLKFYLAEIGGDMSRESTKHGNKAFLAANIMTLLFAGRDTSGAVLTWFFYLISTNPEAKKIILDEIRENSRPQKHTFSNVEELSKLVYLQSALYECLRLFPPVPVIIRDPVQDDVLPSGHKVNKTTKVILCSYAMGRNSKIWGEDFAEFKPERWITDKGEIKHIASNHFLSFGSGPWACPGKELAFARMKGVVATMLHNYHVDVVEGQVITPSLSALLTMKHGLKTNVASKWM